MHFLTSIQFPFNNTYLRMHHFKFGCHECTDMIGVVSEYDVYGKVTDPNDAIYFCSECADDILKHTTCQYTDITPIIVRYGFLSVLLLMIMIFFHH